jgi:hypothetical protein
MLHIVASGLQDRERLNAPMGKPTVEFYKSVMHRRTRWASQWRRVEFDNKPDFGLTAVCTLPIQGELITRATLVIDLPDIYTPQINAIHGYYDPRKGQSLIGPSWAWTNSIGHAICSEVQFLIGDQIIDRFDSRLLEVLDEQTKPVEHFNSTDLLIARDPSTFSDQQTIQQYVTDKTPTAVPQTNPQTLEIIPPFWWNRGPGPQALPIQALWKDKVQLKVTFRTMQECIYTSTRIDPRNPPLSADQGAGPLPNIAGCGFFVTDPSGVPIYNAASTADLSIAGQITNPFPGRVDPSGTYVMPSSFHLTDAYWIIEYVSLEDREAAAYRMADLEIPIEQHIPMPLVTTGGAESVRIRMDQGGLVRELTWVAQRTEAPNYNAYFLFSKDLGPPASPPTLIGSTPLAPVQSPCDIPWWPNAKLPNWDFGDGYIRPAFVDRRSDPIIDATMRIRGLPRFEHDSPSLFRSLLPALNCKRTPLIDRYIYRYDFGFWSTGGLAEALYLPVDEIRGYSNWDKLPKRELALTINQASCTQSQWVIDERQLPFSTYGEQTFEQVDQYFSPTNTEGFLLKLEGAHPDALDELGNNGNGATVLGIIDWTQLRRQPDYMGLYIRTNANGSSSLVLKTTSGYSWIAVAAGGGQGLLQYGGGGYAGNAVEIGWQGGNIGQRHDAIIDASGIIIYNTIGPTNTVQVNNVFISDFFTVINPGIIGTVQLTVSMPVLLQVLVELTHNGVTSTYSLVSPSVSYPASLQSYRFISASSEPIFVYDGDTVVISASAGPILTTQFEAATDASLLAYRVSITDFGTVPTNPQVLYGGGGGGRLIDAGTGEQDGIQMITEPYFVESHQQTGGIQYAYRGGDGYYGGGSGKIGGGGGGSYISELLQQVHTFEIQKNTVVNATLTPIRQISIAQPSFNIYSWITRYNRLRINSGRGAIMFNETA